MKVVIAVQYPILREGIKKILNEASDISILDTAQDKKDLFSLPFEEECIIIMDLNLAELDGKDLVKILLKKHPELEILVLGDDEKQDNVKGVMQKGASGYICKKQNIEELVKAVKKIKQGDIYLSDKTIGMLYNNSGVKTEKEIESAELTEREREILALICQELTNREIANKLSISVRTVDAHRRNVLQKTRAKNTAGLVKYAIKHQIYNLS